MDRSFRLDGENGVGVLLIHGLTGAPGEMKFIARRLNKAGFAIEAPQLAGHGADKATLLRTGWKDWLDSLHASVERLRSRVDHVAVAGICVGGALGLLLAREHADVRAAAVYSMTFSYDGWNMQGWYRPISHLLRPIAWMPGVRSIAFDEPYPFGLKDEKLRAALADAEKNPIPGAIDKLPMGSLYEMFNLAREVERVGKSIRTPTLIVHAQDDDMSHPRNAHRLQAALGGPSRLHMLTNSFHMIHVDQERDVLAKMTADFLQSWCMPARSAAGLVHA